MNREPIYVILERKKQGIDCTEAESAEVKGWLRDIPIPFPQPAFNEVKEHFPIEYNEFLEEVEVKWQESINRFEQTKPVRKYYLVTGYLSNIFFNSYKELSDEKFIELATAEGMVFTEQDFVDYFNINSVINSKEQFLRII